MAAVWIAKITSATKASSISVICRSQMMSCQSGASIVKRPVRNCTALSRWLGSMG